MILQFCFLLAVQKSEVEKDRGGAWGRILHVSERLTQTQHFRYLQKSDIHQHTKAGDVDRVL